jgi:hypothetical protein
MGHYLALCEGLNLVTTLPDNMDGLKEFRDRVKLTLTNAMTGQKALLCALKIAGLFGLRKLFVKRNFQPDDFATLLVYVYLYNIMGVKKNLQTLYRVAKKAQLN